MPSEESKMVPVTKEMLEQAATWPAPEWMPSELQGVYEYAREAHSKQFRKYSGEPYIVHPLDVLRRLIDGIKACSPNPVIEARLMYYFRPVMKACLLHDVVEDCEKSFTEIEQKFGFETAECVFWVTDTLTKAQGNRETRKRLEAARIAAAPLICRCLKLCDIASNTASIVENDPHFAVPYLKEKAHVLFLMMHFDEQAHEAAVVSVFHYLMSKASANVAVL